MSDTRTHCTAIHFPCVFLSHVMLVGKTGISYRTGMALFCRQFFSRTFFVGAFFLRALFLAKIFPNSFFLEPYNWSLFRFFFVRAFCQKILLGISVFSCDLFPGSYCPCVSDTWTHCTHCIHFSCILFRPILF